MKRAGKGSIWELRINDEYICAGTHDQIAEYVGMTPIVLRNMVDHSKKGFGVNVFYDLILLRDSRPTYKMVNDNGEVVVVGTVKEISEKSNYSYSYLINVAKGIRGTRDFQLFRVG